MGSPPPLRVLVVDDDPSVRAVMQMGLSEEGFDVETADGMAAAQALLAAHAAPPSVAVLDLMMVPQDGSQLAAWLRRTYPAVRIVIYSGWPQAEAIQGLRREMQADAFLPKPFNLDDLVRVVRGDE